MEVYRWNCRGSSFPFSLQPGASTCRWAPKFIKLIQQKSTLQQSHSIDVLLVNVSLIPLGLLARVLPYHTHSSRQFSRTFVASSLNIVDVMIFTAVITLQRLISEVTEQPLFKDHKGICITRPLKPLGAELSQLGFANSCESKTRRMWSPKVSFLTKVIASFV